MFLFRRLHIFFAK